MSYIGSTPTQQAYTAAVDYFNGNASTTAFTLSRPVASVMQMIVVIENVPQNPSSAYTVSGNTITFTSAPPSGTNNIWVEYTSPITQVNALSQSPSIVGDVNASGGIYALGAFNSAYTDGMVMDYVTGNGRLTVGAADGFTIYNGGTTGRTALTTWTAAGNVGIGTTNPGQLLDISTTTGDIQLRVGNSVTGSQFTYDIGRVASTGLLQFYGNQNNATGYIFGGINGERMRIASNGYVGIGTNNPQNTLDIQTAAGRLQIQDLGGSSVKLYNSTSGGNIGIDSAGGFTLFYSAGTERMRIDSSGNVLVNTTSAYSASGNTGKTNISFAGASQSGMIILENDNQSNGHFVDFVNSAQTTCGSITRNTTSNAVLYNTSSDYRLKDNIQPITNGLEKLAQLKPSTWIWKDGGNDGEGFIAHEVAQIVPNAVSGEKDALDKDGNPIYQGMDASYLVATLTAALQELKAEVDALKAGK